MFDSSGEYVAAIDQSLHHESQTFGKMALEWSGKLFIRLPGLYRFRLATSGLVKLRVDAHVVSLASQPGANFVGLSEIFNVIAGFHDLQIYYEEATGLASITFEYVGTDTDSTWATVPPTALSHVQGPCDLFGLGYVQNAPCAGPRWALADGDSCSVQCLGGTFPMGQPAASSRLSCVSGTLSNPGFKCEMMQCQAPEIEHATSGCAEGASIHHGQNCTPNCLPDFEAHTWGILSCRNGTMTGSYFCKPRLPIPCLSLSGNNVAHKPQTCGGMPVIPHGASCSLACTSPMDPAVPALSCQYGDLKPQLSSLCLPRLQTSTPQAETGLRLDFLRWVLPVGVFIGALICFKLCTTARKSKARFGESPHGASVAFVDEDGPRQDSVENDEETGSCAESLSESIPPSHGTSHPAGYRHGNGVKEPFLAAVQEQQQQRKLLETEPQEANIEPLLAAPASSSERILSSYWHPVAAPRRGPSQGPPKYHEDNYAWSDVQVAERHARKIPWSDVRADD